MSRLRLTACLLGAAAAAALLGTVTSPGSAQPGKRADLPSDEIVMEYPAGGPMQTAWKVRYVAVSPGPRLVISGAWFKTSPTAEWMKGIGNIRLSEIFVPYNNGTRIYDIGSQGNYRLLSHSAGDAGPA